MTVRQLGRTSRNRRLSLARAWLHGHICVSVNCREGGDNDHARRTQHTKARTIVDASSRSTVASVVHELLCIPPGACRDPLGHVALIQSKPWLDELCDLLEVP